LAGASETVVREREGQETDSMLKEEVEDETARAEDESTGGRAAAERSA